MAFRATQTNIVIDTLIADLVREAIDHRLLTKESHHFIAGPCQRLFDALGLMPCSWDQDLNVDQHDDPELAQKNAQVELMRTRRDFDEQRLKWPSWLVPALAADSSEDELEIYQKKCPFAKRFSNRACQTEQPRLLKRIRGVITPGDGALRSVPAPCEMNRQTIFIDAISVPAPNPQGRPPLADRFCYMLTDFASALYCSLAIMCCCTPSMFR